LLGGEDFRRRDVRERAGQAQVRAIRQRAGERRNFPRRDAQAVHAGVDLQMKLDGALLRLAVLRRGLLQQAQLIRAHHRRCEVIVENPLLLARPEAGEDEHRLADARLAQLGALRRAGHAEPIGVGFGKRARHRNDAVAVGVALDHREDFAPRARAGGVDVGTNGAQVVRERPQADLRPDRAAIKFYRARHWNHQEYPIPARKKNFLKPVRAA
jgi:hypothetical protein